MPPWPMVWTSEPKPRPIAPSKAQQLQTQTRLKILRSPYIAEEDGRSIQRPAATDLNPIPPSVAVPTVRKGWM